MRSRSNIAQLTKLASGYRNKCENETNYHIKSRTNCLQQKKRDKTLIQKKKIILIRIIRCYLWIYYYFVVCSCLWPLLLVRSWCVRNNIFSLFCFRFFVISVEQWTYIYNAWNSGEFRQFFRIDGVSGLVCICLW